MLDFFVDFFFLVSISLLKNEEPCRRPRPLEMNSEGKYLRRSLHLSNSGIAECPSTLGWPDLSLTDSDPLRLQSYFFPSHVIVLRELKEQRDSYLHANTICHLSEPDKPGELQHLHHNIRSNNSGVRNLVIFKLSAAHSSFSMYIIFTLRSGPKGHRGLFRALNYTAGRDDV
uniref:Uncharacterized protein n=1 Tax=Salarias fasciatus TaxID=181472 RepID=A0A672J9Q6_SALFA